MPPRAGSDQVTIVDDAPAPEPPAEALEAPPPAPVAPPSSPADDATATLERLASLRDRGLITAEEYDAKKRELLERI
jgi:hypothetical protein